MPCYEIDGLRPVVDPTAYVHPTAVLIGDVVIGPGAYIGPCASLRGDFGRIVLQNGCNVQDTCVIHGFPASDTLLEDNAHIGHGAVLHGCVIRADALVGMNAVVMDEAEIGAGAFVAASAFVRAGLKVPARSLAAGVPAKILRELSDQELAWKREGTATYQRLTERCLATMKEVRAAGGRGAGPQAAGRRRRAAAGGHAARGRLRPGDSPANRLLVLMKIVGSRGLARPQSPHNAKPSGATMDQREFEAVVDEFGASAKDLVELVEQARYEQPTAMAISRLLDAREDLLALIAKLPALRAVDAAGRDARRARRPARAHRPGARRAEDQPRLEGDPATGHRGGRDLRRHRRPAAGRRAAGPRRRAR